MARPKKIITIDPEQLVFDLAGLGHSKREIAVLLDISPDTVDNRYRTFYDKGKESGKSKLRTKLVSLAMKGNVTALIFALKNLCGFADKVSQEISGPDQGPIQIDEVRQSIESKLRGISARTGTTEVPE